MSLPVRLLKKSNISSRQPDNIVLADGVPFRITNLTEDLLIGEVWSQVEDIFDIPIASRCVGMFKVSWCMPIEKTPLRSEVQVKKAILLHIDQQEYVLKICHIE